MPLPECTDFDPISSQWVDRRSAARATAPSKRSPLFSAKARKCYVSKPSCPVAREESRESASGVHVPQPMDELHHTLGQQYNAG